jgi:tRNA(adenine34) deaminase
MNSKFFEICIKEANKSLKYGDVPVGAVLVINNKIISKAHNTREKKFMTINHAELLTILKANKKLKKYYLYDSDLYVTLKPCEMCQKVINNARIKNVYYLLDKPETKKEYNKTEYKVIHNELSENYKKKLQRFFNNIR